MGPITIRVLVGAVEIECVTVPFDESDRVATEKARLATIYGRVRLTATCDDWPTPCVHDVTYDGTGGTLLIREVPAPTGGTNA
mgnify:CR=1 FL=1